MDIKYNINFPDYSICLPLTKELLKAWLDIETIGCSSLSAAVLADEYLFDFLLLSCILIFQSASVPGLDQQ